ncbi:MAG: CAP domain-containing protein [Thermoleophilaceae bacterium]|nr:CAP domain-containing protein [Thermoleophilaceae bacterium]
MLLIAAPTASAKSKRCEDAGLVPTSADQMVRIQRATRCLVNRERTRRGLKRLKFNDRLQKSSDYQAADMLKHRYFGHNRRGGRRFADRILDFGYDPDRSGYALGENLAWASSPIATPRRIVSGWMHSPSHRANMLNEGFRDQAVSALWSDGGVGGAYKDSNGPFVIFVNQFGVRY